ncbi:hypothetical protein V8E55_003245 [Tylopilus felleus]
MPECHHYVGSSHNDPEDLMLFVRHNCDDPAITNFILDLKAHLLPRIAEIHGKLPGYNETVQSLSVGDPDSNGEQLSHVIIQHNRIYRHKTICVNFTTYDLCRETDVIKPKSDHSDILMLSPGKPDKHHFYYARVIGIFHANVIYTGMDSKDYLARRMEFLWVRWFEKQEQPSGWQQSSLDILKFMPMAAPGAFRFVNPDDVLRGYHLIPRFCTGRLRSDGIPVSQIAGDADDWKAYYVNRFVDQDMLLRYHWGLTVGHTYTHSHQNGEAGVNFSHGHGWLRNPTAYTEPLAPGDEESPTEHFVEHRNDSDEDEDWQSGTEEGDASSSSDSDSDESLIDTGCNYGFGDL